MRNLIILVLLAGILETQAQKYDLAAVTPELLKGANAIILKDQTEITVEKANKVQSRKFRAIAMLNRQGEAAFDTWYTSYDAFKKIRKIEAAAYNLQGELLLKSKNSDVRDVAVNPLDNSVTDIRVKMVSLDRKLLTLPYILEFTVEEESRETFFYEDWTPVTALHMAIVESTYQIRSPLSMDYRARALHLDQPPVKTVHDGWKTETWKLNNFPALTSDRYLPPQFLPQVHFAPVQYQIDKYSGTVTSWNDIGNFYLQLNSGRDVLPQEIKDKVRAVVGKETDTLRRAQKVYEFMQGHTRYFNISFRLGGWQSLPAAAVAEKGYGDCKALTNYTLALLKEAGVKAYPALVNAGAKNQQRESEDFPKNAFNHIIACVPTARDTVWLECTSQTNPFGYLGSFTGNRKALLITEDASRLVNTRSYAPEENALSSSVTIHLQKDGSGEVAYSSLYEGLRQEEVSTLARSKDKELQRRWLTERVSLSDIRWQDFRIETLQNGIGESGSLSGPALGTFSGQRFFFRPYVLTGFLDEVTDDGAAGHAKEFYLNPNEYSFTDTDTVRVTLPEGFVAESLPRDVHLEVPFGIYTSTATAVQPRQLQYVRQVVVRGGHYPGEVYPQWIDFIKAVNRADRQRTVLRKTQ